MLSGRVFAFPAVCVANSVDPDQTPQNVASDQGLHCLLLPVRRIFWVNKECIVVKGGKFEI